MAALIETRSVSKRFIKKLDLAGKIVSSLGADIREETVHAVDGVDLVINKGEVIGLVGESGCGKSTIGRMIAGILPKSDGEILFKGQALTGGSSAFEKEAMLAVQMIFQDPYSSLNPRLKVLDIVGEAPVYHGLIKKKEREKFVREILIQVGLDPDYISRFPHQFSGGQRQRVGIARALALSPEFLVCDEAIAALDVSIQAQVLNLFMDLRERHDLTYLFISHDLSVVEHISDKVVIMYLGRVVEYASTDDLFNSPNHPYTKALLQEIPRVDQRSLTYRPIQGEIPSPLNPPTGCHFHPRCPVARLECSNLRPTLKEIAPGHWSACLLNN